MPTEPTPPPPSLVTPTPGVRATSRPNPLAASSPNPLEATTELPPTGPTSTTDSTNPSGAGDGSDGGEATSSATKRTTGRSSAGSTDRPSEREGVSIAKALGPIAVAAVRAVGMLLHTLRTSRSPVPNVVWIPNEDEAEAIAEPLARIAARHMPAGAGSVNSDVADVLELGIAAGAYAMHHAQADALVRSGYDPTTGQPYAAPPVPEPAAA